MNMHMYDIYMYDIYINVCLYIQTYVLALGIQEQPEGQADLT
jgi:hypothetical protein